MRILKKKYSHIYKLNMANTWIQALRQFNEKKGGTWCVPKKGTDDHAAVMKIKAKIEKKEARAAKKAAKAAKSV
jgi:hypothetical protein